MTSRFKGRNVLVTGGARGMGVAASAEAGYCTGAEVAVDGGWSAGEPSPIFVAPGAQLPEVAPL